MDKKSIIESVKRQEEEKVGFSLKLPSSLKDQLQSLAESEKISMNALIVATMQSLLDDECGKKLSIAKNLLVDYKSYLSNSISDLEEIGIDPDNANSYEKCKSNYKQVIELLKD